jgi:thiamine pyrophosphate-dependent acetolactate synthase large subunit-like protein
MSNDHPLSVAAARTLALQNADVVFLMGRASTGSCIPAFAGTGFRLPPRYAPDLKVIQLDIAPEEIGHNRRTDAALVGLRVGPWPAREQALARRSCSR